MNPDSASPSGLELVPPPRLYRWTVLGVAWLALLFAVIDRIAWSNVSAKAGVDFGVDAIAALSIFASVSHVGFFFAALFGGLLTDWFGPRKMLTGTMLGLGACTIAFGQAQSLLGGLAFQFVMGLLAGPAYPIGAKLISCWFPRIGRASAMGIFMTGTSLAVLLVNMIMPFVAEYATWRGAFLRIGGVTMLIGAAALLFVRDQPGAPMPRAAATSPFATVMPLLRNPNFRWLALANWGGPWGTWGFAIWASILLVRVRHMSIIEAGTVVASFGAGAVVAKLFIGMISDLLNGRRKMLTVTILLIYAIGLVIFAFIEDPVRLKLFALVLGMFAFAYGPLINIMVAETAGDHAGSAAGLSIVLTTAGDSVQPILLAFVYNATGSFLAVLAVLAAGPALAALSVWQVDEDFDAEKASAAAPTRAEQAA